MASAKFIGKIEGWDENTITETDSGGKLTQATVKQSFSGDVEGDASVQWLMCYRPDQTAEFVGMQRVVGRIGDRSGSFVMLQTDGTFDGKVATGKLTIVPGSGTDDLAGLSGGGEFRAPMGGEPSAELDYELG
jgi:Protein of unknown function (DUF3224)